MDKLCQMYGKISSGIHGAINEINWINLGNLLGNWFMVSWKILYGIVKDFPYKDLGTSIGKGIKGAIEKIDFQVITDTFVNLFNGIFDFLKNFNAEKPFKGLGKKISLAINNSLDELDASGAGETLSNFVLSILDELVDIAEGTDWEKFGRKIGEFLSSINWKEILSKVSELISKTLSGLFNGLESSGLAGSILSWIVKAILAIKVISPAIKLVSKISAALTGSQSANIMTSAFSKLFSGSLANGSKSLSNLDKSLNTTKSWMSKLGESSMWTAGIFDIFKTQLDNMEIHKHASEYGALQSAIHKLGGQSGLTTKEINKFSGELINAQRAKVPFGDALVYVREELRKSGVSSEKFKSALEKSLDELGVSAPKKSKIIGTAIGEGTTKGISESTEKVRNANKSLIDKIKEWWTGKSGFDIHSPSKYMFSVGENIISGLYNGTNSSTLNPGNFESISCNAEPAQRNSAKRYTSLEQTRVELDKNIQKEKTDREQAMEELADRLSNAPGVFTTVQTDIGGGKIFFLHNKPNLSDSDMVWKMTAEAWAVSTDGGKTWNAGMTVDGDTIVRILTAVGVNADWINAGAITVKDSSGSDSD